MLRSYQHFNFTFFPSFYQRVKKQLMHSQYFTQSKGASLYQQSILSLIQSQEINF
ncbi:hypothetical protein TTHERM_000599919 (macronuclear) [Tetrahymena thermophila SB210]|uniref:Uncharacterized protein n=1 Tax=Tetrahymena thermophila (strain SB210) TaxID=312017 RepID=W7XA19_TETTS|nr:hypothetical protein TTHERM_000599919 [Tetrahymena thermophila SB210]EWS73248.1 hypothetical protein TTHERM_000599919 [Tetrahymena thermophila SB210]|eukprot:XP_012654212.1 hypothetical protein TTHERM_000599919 [Tetrahymena thermophila SB210]